MLNVRVVTPAEAHLLLEQQGYRYLDVRTEPEFEAGHPPGAFNIPLLHAAAAGMTANEAFLSVALAHFDKSARLVVGCKSGGRSRRATEMLLEAGYGELVELTAGWDGKRDAVGRLQPGWSRAGLPIESGNPAQRCYADLAAASHAKES